MKQLNLWEENRHDMIFEHENQIATYRDVLYQQNEQITYAEYCEPKKVGFFMESSGKILLILETKI